VARGGQVRVWRRNFLREVPDGKLRPDGGGYVMGFRTSCKVACKFRGEILRVSEGQFAMEKERNMC
jgi:hypothetical protein